MIPLVLASDFSGLIPGMIGLVSFLLLVPLTCVTLWCSVVNKPATKIWLKFTVPLCGLQWLGAYGYFFGDSYYQKDFWSVPYVFALMVPPLLLFYAYRCAQSPASKAKVSHSVSTVDPDSELKRRANEGEL